MVDTYQQGDREYERVDDSGGSRRNDVNNYEDAMRSGENFSTTEDNQFRQDTGGPYLAQNSYTNDEMYKEDQYNNPAQYGMEYNNSEGRGYAQNENYNQSAGNYADQDEFGGAQSSPSYPTAGDYGSDRTQPNEYSNQPENYSEQSKKYEDESEGFRKDQENYAFQQKEQPPDYNQQFYANDGLNQNEYNTQSGDYSNRRRSHLEQQKYPEQIGSASNGQAEHPSDYDTQQRSYMEQPNYTSQMREQRKESDGYLTQPADSLNTFPESKSDPYNDRERYVPQPGLPTTQTNQQDDYTNQPIDYSDPTQENEKSIQDNIHESAIRADDQPDEQFNQVSNQSDDYKRANDVNNQEIKFNDSIQQNQSNDNKNVSNIEDNNSNNYRNQDEYDYPEATSNPLAAFDGTDINTNQPDEGWQEREYEHENKRKREFNLLKQPLEQVEKFKETMEELTKKPNVEQQNKYAHPIDESKKTEIQPKPDKVENTNKIDEDPSVNIASPQSNDSRQSQPSKQTVKQSNQASKQPGGGPVRQGSTTKQHISQLLKQAAAATKQSSLKSASSGKQQTTQQTKPLSTQSRTQPSSRTNR